MARIWVAFLGALTIVASPSAQRPTTPSISDLLETYNRGEYAAAVHAGASLPNLAEWQKAYPIAARVWIDRSPEDVQRRRLVAAGLIVEVTRERYERDWVIWGPLRDVVEWACEQLRRAPQATRGEQAWFRASVALAQRARDRTWLAGLPVNRGPGIGGQGQVVLDMFAPKDFIPTPVDHLAHARVRFSTDRLFDLAGAIARSDAGDTDLVSCCVRVQTSLSTFALPTHVDGRPAGDYRPDPAVSDAAVAQFTPLLEDPAVGAMAEVHASHLYMVRRDYRAALTHALAAAQAARDGEMRYLGFVLAGMAAERLGGEGEARVAYAEALKAKPNGQAATWALTALTAGESPTDAANQIEASLLGPSADDDPLRLYYYGDYMYWPTRINELHEALR